MYEYRKLTPAEREEIIKERLEKGFPRHQPPHPLRDRAYYLLTAACYEHRHHMQAQARRQAVLEALREQSERYRVTLRAWVVLPNHYHILAEVTDFGALSEFFSPCAWTHGSSLESGRRHIWAQGLVSVQRPGYSICTALCRYAQLYSLQPGQAWMGCFSLRLEREQPPVVRGVFRT